MKLDLIAPNARYDLVHGRPDTIERDNDGSTVYRFNIAPEMGAVEGEEEETQIGWSCVEVRTFVQPTKANLKKAVIRAFFDESQEMNLINDYNAHMMGVSVNEDAVDNYIEFLQFIKDLDLMLVADLGL